MLPNMMLIPKLILIFLGVFSLSYVIAIIISELTLRYNEARERERRYREPAIRRFWDNVYSTESVRPSGATMSPSPSAIIDELERQREGLSAHLKRRYEQGGAWYDSGKVLDEFLTREEMEI